MDNIAFNSDMWNIRKFPFPQGSEYLEDLESIIFANSGLITEVNPFYFVNEACQLIANAVMLFEDGYFDCAFYSIRQSLEITVSGLFLFLNPNKLKKWDALENGFEVGTMISSMENNQQNFKEIRDTFKDFFDVIKADKKYLNKYVHKQGITSMYAFYNDASAYKKPKRIEELIQHFEKSLKDSISAAAIYRLIIDPYPILMLDEDMVMRMPDIIAEQYPVQFIEKYLSWDFVEKYKRTSIYQCFYDHFKQHSVQNEAVYNLIHYQLFKRKDYDIVMTQKKLLSLFDTEAVEILMLSKKIGKIMIDGCLEYSCETKLKNKGTVLGESYYSEIFSDSQDWNVPFKGDFISRCSLNKSFCYLFHKAVFCEDEVQSILSRCERCTDDYNAANY